MSASLPCGCAPPERWCSAAWRLSRDLSAAKRAAHDAAGTPTFKAKNEELAHAEAAAQAHVIPVSVLAQ